MEHARITPAGAPLSALPLILATLDRQALETLAEAAIARLDELDGDPDVEDATDVEDDFSFSSRALGDEAIGAGCPISDPDEASEDPNRFGDVRALFPTWPLDQRRTLGAGSLAIDREIMRPHRNRVRRESCERVQDRRLLAYGIEYRLLD